MENKDCEKENIMCDVKSEEIAPGVSRHSVIRVKRIRKECLRQTQRKWETIESKGVGVGENLDSDNGELFSVTEGMDQGNDS